MTLSPREEEDEGSEESMKTKRQTHIQVLLLMHSDNQTHMHTNENIGGVNSQRVQTVQTLHKCATSVPGEVDV